MSKLGWLLPKSSSHKLTFEKLFTCSNMPYWQEVVLGYHALLIQKQSFAPYYYAAVEKTFKMTNNLCRCIYACAIIFDVWCVV